MTNGLGCNVNETILFFEIRQFSKRCKHPLRAFHAGIQGTAGAGTGEWVGSNFERKYLKEERAFYAIAVEKNASVFNGIETA